MDFLEFQTYIAIYFFKKNQLQAMVRLRFACYFAQMVFYPLPNTCTVLPFPGRNFELKRENIKLLEVLGEGQFGDVFKGLFTDKVGAWLCTVFAKCYSLTLFYLVYVCIWSLDFLLYVYNWYVGWSSVCCSCQDLQGG